MTKFKGSDQVAAPQVFHILFNCLVKMVIYYY